MRRRVFTTCLTNATPKQMPTARLLFLVTCTSCVLSLIWLQLVSSPNELFNDNLLQEALKNVAKDSRYSEVYRKTSRLPKDLKYILLWTRNDFAPFYSFKKGQRAFIKNNCSVINCYVTSDRNFFNGNLTKFDAIAFNGRNMQSSDLPKQRSSHQKYIFFNTESADNYPVCNSVYDGFFNWTATYRLDSDIPFPYIMIRNNEGEIVGPKIEMHWDENLPELDEDLVEKLANKSKAAAWFVSHCATRSGRTELAKSLQKALALYDLTVDIYGSCGPLRCPRYLKNYCNLLLERDYFFYLSLENSFAEDYVTEKLLTALRHNVLPIIYGGANYSRFLPPHSYLDAREHSVTELAKTMDRLMHSPKLYNQYFKWKGRYTYSDPWKTENICAVCAALNNKELVGEPTTYEHFRRWWDPGYLKRC